MIHMLLWLPRVTLGRLFRPLNAWFDELEADAEFLVQAYKKANPEH